MTEPRPWQILSQADPEIYSLVEAELRRQKQGIELIASENFASEAVIATMGSILTNKYAEGLPHKRYYGGCEQVDRVEDLAIERAKTLFGCEFANVQPHSGATANAAVFLALAKAGDPVLGMDLSHGGHLTHGSKVNFSGSLYDSHFYRLDETTERLNYDQILEVARQVKPRILVAGASAYAREIDFGKFREIADDVGAYLMVDMAHIAGLVAAGEHSSPLPHAHVVTTTTHKTLRGPRGGLILWNDEELGKKINKGVFPGTQGGPLEHIIAAKAVCFEEAQQPSFKAYQKQVVANAQCLADNLLERGFHLVSGGTDNHLVLVDVSSYEVSGKEFEEALQKAHITVNKNTVPKEKRSPFVTSGVRLGTPAVTSRGFQEPQIVQIAEWITAVFANTKSDGALLEVGAQVQKLCDEFPLYPKWECPS